MNRCRTFWCISFFVALFFTFALHVEAALIYKYDYESGTFDDLGLNNCLNPTRCWIITNPVRFGAYAQKATVNSDTNPSGNMHSVVLRPSLFPALFQGTERWMGFSVYVPTDYFFDSDVGNNGQIIFQAHSVPDVCDFPGLSPGFSIAISPQGTWSQQTCWDENACSITNCANKERRNLGLVQRGKWTDFVVNLIPTHQSTGKIGVWVDGVNKVNYTGL